MRFLLETEGNEPYLVSVEAVEAGLHPYVEVHDVGSKLNEDGTVALYTASRGYNVDPATVLVWR